MEAHVMTHEVPKAVQRKWLRLDALCQVVRQRQAQGDRIVFTNGCFDVIHAGHVRYLRSARRLGDGLIVAVNDDGSVRRLKGPDRPLYPLAERMEVLAAFPFVTWLTDFSTGSVLPVMKQVRPDVIAKGGDYRISQVIGWQFVRSYGGRVVVLDHVAGRSTTNTVRAMRGRALKK